MKKRKRNSFIRRTERSLISLWEFLSDNKKRVMPIILLICVAVTILIAIRANRIAADQAIADADLNESGGSVSFEATQAQLVKDAYPEINALISRYFDAYVSGDVSILKGGLYRTLDEIEVVTIEERAKYIEEIANLTVYTKPGPEENSWVAYAYTDVRYIGCDDYLPAALSLYICRDDNGDYYINADETAQSVKDYIKDASMQDDVVDLYNRINVAYAEKLESNPMMSELVAAIYAQIDESVGERLSGAELAVAQAEQTGQPAESTSVSEAPAAASTDAGEAASVAAPEPPKEVKIRATTTVNVRKSDSTEAEVLGKAREGEEYVRITEQGNGWSKISFAGGAAFVKTEYFEVVSEEGDTPAAAEPAENAAQSASTATGATTASSAASTGSSKATASSSAASTGSSGVTASSSAASTGSSRATASSSAASTGSSKASASSSAASTGSSGTGASSSTASTAGTGSTKTGGITGTGSKTVAGSGVRVRKEANTESDVLATLYPGAKITVKKNRDDGWSEVEYKGKTGYIKTEFLTD
ncbi:MAG: SH3 domain-containing protein [Lachnospiraceae bacterium]|nr:SH3 domain-containing protein [Lachnospiraceae bacterium]